jgi:hypothetical protein
VLLRVGISPPVADEMELWQLGALLGTDEDRTEGIDPELWARERDSLKDRAAAIRDEGRGEDKPVEETDITDMVMSQMGIVPG